MAPESRTSGTARRSPEPTQPEPTDENTHSGRALDRERERGAVDTVHDAGRQPGAHGKESPQRNIKPGTRRDIEEAQRGNA